MFWKKQEKVEPTPEEKLLAAARAFTKAWLEYMVVTRSRVYPVIFHDLRELQVFDKEMRKIGRKDDGDDDTHR